MRRILLLGPLNSLIMCVYAQNVDILIKPRFSISAGYIGGFENLSDEKDKLNGFSVQGAVKTTPRIGFYTEYNKQKMSILKFNEVVTGGQYTFYDGQKVNGVIGGGIGYMWLDQNLYDPHTTITADLKLKYITLPVFIEGETKLSKHFSYFSTLSYQWLFNYDSTVCFTLMGIETMCDSIKEDANGLVYKLGVRYNF